MPGAVDIGFLILTPFILFFDEFRDQLIQIIKVFLYLKARHIIFCSKHPVEKYNILHFPPKSSVVFAALNFLAEYQNVLG